MCHPDLPGGGRTDALGSAIDLAPTLLDIAGVDAATVAEQFPNLRGTSLLPALTGRHVRDGGLTAVEIVTTLDNGYWRSLGAPGGPERVQAGTLRPDWTKRGFLRGYTDHRYTFGGYFSPLQPNRPGTVERLLADNDVVLYDRRVDPHEQVNLANDEAQRELVTDLLGKLEALIDAEIGTDTRAWVTERPRLVGWPTWRGDAA